MTGKRALHDTQISFYASADLKEKAVAVLTKEGKGLSEFLRFALYEKIKEHKED